MARLDLQPHPLPQRCLSRQKFLHQHPPWVTQCCLHVTRCLLHLHCPWCRQSDVLAESLLDFLLHHLQQKSPYPRSFLHPHLQLQGIQKMMTFQHQLHQHRHLPWGTSKVEFQYLH